MFKLLWYSSPKNYRQSLYESTWNICLEVRVLLTGLEMGAAAAGAAGAAAAGFDSGGLADLAVTEGLAVEGESSNFNSFITYKINRTKSLSKIL